MHEERSLFRVICVFVVHVTRAPHAPFHQVVFRTQTMTCRRATFPRFPRSLRFLRTTDDDVMSCWRSFYKVLSTSLSGCSFRTRVDTVKRENGYYAGCRLESIFVSQKYY